MKPKPDCGLSRAEPTSSVVPQHPWGKEGAPRQLLPTPHLSVPIITGCSVHHLLGLLSVLLTAVLTLQPHATCFLTGNSFPPHPLLLSWRLTNHITGCQKASPPFPGVVWLGSDDLPPHWLLSEEISFLSLLYPLLTASLWTRVSDIPVPQENT